MKKMIKTIIIINQKIQKISVRQAYLMHIEMLITKISKLTKIYGNRITKKKAKFKNNFSKKDFKL